jgi:outer membrane protein TolC
VRVISNQYRAGLVSYLNVTQVQTTALGVARSVLEVQNRRLIVGWGG